MIWNELITEDLASARQFYDGLFGWTFESAKAQGAGEYLLARNGDGFVAGLRAGQARADGKKVTCWLPWLSVDNVDAALERHPSLKSPNSIR